MLFSLFNDLYDNNNSWLMFEPFVVVKHSIEDIISGQHGNHTKNVM